MKPYAEMFRAAEDTLRRECSPPGAFDAGMERFARPRRPYTDNDGEPLTDQGYWLTIVDVVFYSGFRAATVQKHLHTIHRHLGDPGRLEGYGDPDIDAVLRDPEMIRNRNKVQACVVNAHQFCEMARVHGSFGRYIESFGADKSLENLMILKEELECRFSFLGGITAYHFLIDIGLPAIKPDLTITRLFRHLGLIRDERQVFTTIAEGLKFSRAAKRPPRYVDTVFAAFGQAGKNDELGLRSGVCLDERRRRCSICGLRPYCLDPDPSVVPVTG